MADIYPLFHDTIDDTPPPMISARLIGHQTILETMLAEFGIGKMHHATILSGPQGIGKATLAFHFARQVFALAGEANATEKIEAGTHPSLMHVTRSLNEDTKKYRTEIVVADIHRANHFLSRTASGGGTRIIIIDPADDMNRNAANALLKNLEEPPAKTYYFLISHVSGRLLPTIRSRCRMVNVPALMDAQVTEVLTRNLGLDHSEAAELARYSEGSVRQAMTMARYGGIDIVAALNVFAADQKFSAVAAQNLASAVSDRESEPRYALLTDLIEQRLATAARAHAQKGNPQDSVAISELYQAVQQQRVLAEGYKLDRKLEVFNVLRRVHTYLAAASTNSGF
jgi:DNA polymerase III subunit delta'